MLLSFRFANHRSFRDEQHLNLVPVYETDIDPDTEDVLQTVPVVGIFGANASGKSNVISAFRYLSTMVGQSDRESEPGFGPQRQPFRLDREAAAQPSFYVADLLLDGIRHTYGFAVDKERVTEEWLYSYPRRRKRVIFGRTGQDFEWGEESGRSNIRALTDIVAPTALFLSVSARFDSRDQTGESRDSTVESLHNVYTWFRQKVVQDERLQHILLNPKQQYAQWLSDPVRRAAIADLLRNADLGLQNILTVDFTAPDEPTGPPYGREVLFLHEGALESVFFTTADESSGTLRLLELAARAIPVLNGGGLFLVDEIDASLHPLLTAALVRLFQSREVNQHGAQLVFTTHDATLLGSIDGEDLLRRDEVWFTNKGDDGASELFSLSEFKPRRQGENREKRYLNGTYGAIPELSMRLFEQAIASRAEPSGE
jgi:AAA15 family ATPase/GTPase